MKGRFKAKGNTGGRLAIDIMLSSQKKNQTDVLIRIVRSEA